MRVLQDKCPKCGKEFSCISKWGDRKKFCSRKCANSRSWDETKKKRHSIIAKSLPTYKPPIFEKRTCVCGKSFSIEPYKKKTYCSLSCVSKYSPKPPGFKSGGYREGSGRSKSGYYKGIYCGSTYELCWVIYQIDHNLPFKRFEGCLEKNNLKYYPDFLVENKIVEIKGYWTEAVERKKELAESLGYNIEILYKKDLLKIFRYVESKYGTKKFQTLYDDHKPIYSGVCSFCKKEFFRDSRIKTKDVFCSRLCSGKYRKVKNTPCR